MIEREVFYTLDKITYLVPPLLGLAFSLELKNLVRRLQGGRCASCGSKPKKLEIHHIIPQSMGGKDTFDNAVGLCSPCHEHYDKLALEKGIFFKK